MRVATIIAPALVLIVAGASVSAAQGFENDRAGTVSSQFAPSVDLWLDQPSYNRGARMRPHFTTEPGAYVVIVRVTPKGELLMMYPELPGSQKPFMLGQYPNDRIPYSEVGGLYEAGGLGFVFAIASYHPFDFRALRGGNRWSGLAKFGRFDDPFEAVRSFVRVVLPSTAEYSLDSEVYELFAPRASGNVYRGDFGYISRDDSRTR